MESSFHSSHVVLAQRGGASRHKKEEEEEESQNRAVRLIYIRLSLVEKVKKK